MASPSRDRSPLAVQFVGAELLLSTVEQGTILVTPFVDAGLLLSTVKQTISLAVFFLVTELLLSTMERGVPSEMPSVDDE